jgi:hypothetical protein
MHINIDMGAFVTGHLTCVRIERFSTFIGSREHMSWHGGCRGLGRTHLYLGQSKATTMIVDT